MKNKLQNTQQFNKELKGTNQSQNETLKKVHKQQWSRRGFLKGTLIGVSALVIRRNLWRRVPVGEGCGQHQSVKHMFCAIQPVFFR